MGITQNLAKEVIKEIGNKSRDFYQFVLPPVDMSLDGENLIVTIDIPGFKKEEIKLSIMKNVLSIKAKKKETQKTEELICNQRPNIIDKKILLPIRIKKGEEKVSYAKYIDGVLTIKIPFEDTGKQISIE